MIGHDIGTAGGNCRAAAAIALADFALGVPVGVLYDVEQADGAPACVVVLIPAGAFALCAAAGRCSGDAYQRRHSGARNMAGAGIVATDVSARAGVLVPPGLLLVSDVVVPLFSTGVVHDLVPKIRDVDDYITVAAPAEAVLALLRANGVARDVVLLHTGPRGIIVKGTTARAGTNSGHRFACDINVHETVRVIFLPQSCAYSRAGPIIPAYAKNSNIEKFEGILPTQFSFGTVLCSVLIQHCLHRPSPGAR